MNPIDWEVLAGAMSGAQPLAGTGYLGRDAADVVDQIGEGVAGVSAGEEVSGLAPGCDATAPLPAGGAAEAEVMP